MENTPAPPGGPAKASPISLGPGWLLFAALALAIPLAALAVHARREPPAQPLPVFSALPDFALVDEAARPFSRKDLLGRAWVVDFIFTSCPDACPRLTAIMKQLQDSLTSEERQGAVGLLSISVDPARDTPAVMQAYARARGADARVWRFLTGEQGAIERTVIEGFKSAIEKVELEAPQGEPHAQLMRILHGEKFVLVDAAGRIRGYYDVRDALEQQRLLRDLRQLLRGDS